VEQHNFEIRKQLLEYDNVMNKQREVIYGQRRSVLEGTFSKEDMLDIVDKIISDIVAVHINENISPRDWDIAGLINTFRLKFGIDIDASGIQNLNKEGIREQLYNSLTAAYEEREKSIGSDTMRHLERMVFLQILDSKWKDHLYAMDNLREGIGLRAYGQRDPLIEYKREAFEMFSQMISSIEEEATEVIFKLQPVKLERFKGIFSEVSQEFLHPEAVKFEAPSQQLAEAEMLAESASGTTPPIKPAQSSKVGRNDPCPCGSGKKYKRCCGR
jgi:preprotein translocase subunit SecA